MTTPSMPRCRFCREPLQLTLVDLGTTPLANSYVPPEKLGTKDPVFPLHARVCSNCRLVQVGREFQRPIAYDVDYVYKGTKYRSRLAEDPGNRLRVRVSVTPYEAGAPLPPP